MAAPLSPQILLDILRAEGLDVVEHLGWRDRCRCHDGSHERGEHPSGRAWGPIHGVTAHITTGARYTGQQALDYTTALIVRGNGSTPGPLCQICIDGDGRVILSAAGRSNHGGSISQRAKDAMLAGSFSTSGWQDLRGSGVDGNTLTYGVEMFSPSGPAEVQVESFVRVAAAISRYYGWTGQETHGHGEVADQRGYSDPGYDMGDIRRRVMALVVSGAVPGGGGGQSAPVPPPAPAPSWDGSSFPGAGAFVLGRSHPAVTLLGQRLVAHGYTGYQVGPGSTFTEVDKRGVREFQEAQGWTGSGADGIPGPQTWDRLMADPSSPVLAPTPAPSVPVLALDHVIAAVALDSADSNPTGRVNYGDPAGSRALEQALADLGYDPGPIDGSLGTSFKRAYARWQRRLGYSGGDADGVPGRASLVELGNRTGRFTVA